MPLVSALRARHEPKPGTPPSKRTARSRNEHARHEPT
jgi:hypothetical protein